MTLFSQPIGAQAAACKFAVVPSANQVADQHDLIGLSSTAANDVWADGGIDNPNHTRHVTLIELFSC